MLDSGMMCPSQSAWCNTIVLVQRNYGTLHFCIDYCCLNACKKKDSYPLLGIQEALAIFLAWTWNPDSGRSRWTSCWSSTPHLLSATWASFECDCMPFGVCNVSATFQRLMQNCLRELNLTYCLIYFNDIFIFLQTAVEHLHHLCIIFNQFREHNLKLKPSKCNFFRNEITYLARQVSKDGVYPSDLNLKAITECALPQTYMEVHTFLGLVGHYRRFIKGFTHHTAP